MTMRTRVKLQAYCAGCLLLLAVSSGATSSSDLAESERPSVLTLEEPVDEYRSLKETLANLDRGRPWNLTTNHGMFGWSPEVLKRVTDFVVKPGAGQVVFDDLVRECDSEESVVVGLQVLDILGILDIGEPGCVHPFDGSEFAALCRSGGYDRVVDRIAGKDLLAHYLRLALELAEAGAREAK
jgi:hypothetical protein